jgi:tripartite-type tricarboxylate transporter receptor subunit TctC
MELFLQQLHLDAVHVPYRGGALSAMPDLLGGEVQFAYVPVNAARPLVTEGKLRMLAVASSKRTPLAPDAPSLSELGYPTLDFETWFGFFGPAGLPRDIVRKWDAELASINAMPDVKEALLKQGLEPFPLDATGTAAQLKKEIARWREVVEKAGIKPE